MHSWWWLWLWYHHSHKLGQIGALAIFSSKLGPWWFLAANWAPRKCQCGKLGPWQFLPANWAPAYWVPANWAPRKCQCGKLGHTKKSKYVELSSRLLILYCQIQNASFFARDRLCIHRIADPRFARIDKSMSFTNHSFLLSYHSFMSLRWFLPCQTQCHRFSVYFNLNPECYDTYIMWDLAIGDGLFTLPWRQ